MFYLADIAASCRKILRFTEGMSIEQFVADEKTYDAVVRNVEIIGEAAKNIPVEITEMIDDIEWRKAAGMRDMLAHAYFGIDNDILWDVIRNKVPELLDAVERFTEKQADE
jgi:uncharacterized protein with HEPN domain